MDTELKEHDIVFGCAIAGVEGTLTDPPHDKEPCVVILGGSHSHTRDGEMMHHRAPKRDALKRLADALARGGVPSYRFDKVPFGKSRRTRYWTGVYADEALVAATAIRVIREQFDRVIVVGEGAGVYLACIAAMNGVQADGYIFLGGHCGSGEEMYRYNFDPLAEYVGEDPSRQTWARRHDLHRSLALGKRYMEMFDAARAGLNSFLLKDGEFSMMIDLRRRREELDLPPDEMFRHIASPVLALSGARDLNVAPDHAEKIAQTLRRFNNENVVAGTLSGVDHIFQFAPDDPVEAFLERHTFASFNRPYDGRLYRVILDWLESPEKAEQTLASFS
ncbi:MAG: hypothetical protein O3A46_15970 [Candidatus Poribacteria bacterium]|nr:hypothetical protein [Candidatus Poribacteria bacterium]